MSKNFTIDGREFCGTEAGFDYLRGILKELDVQVDDLQEWEHHVTFTLYHNLVVYYLG